MRLQNRVMSKEAWLEVRHRAGAFTNEMYKKPDEDASIARAAWQLAKTLVGMRDESPVRKGVAERGAADAIEHEARLLYPLLRDHFRERMNVKPASPAEGGVKSTS